MWPHVDEGTIGTIFFEWSDEPLKEAMDQRTMGLVRYKEAGSGRTSSLQPNVWTADTLERKPIVFDAASKGDIDGVKVRKLCVYPASFFVCARARESIL